MLLPLPPQLWLDLAVALAEHGETADALFCAAQAMAVGAPGGSDPLGSGPWSADAHHALGRVQERASRLEAARDSYNTALALDPLHAPTLLSLGEGPGPGVARVVRRGLRDEGVECGWVRGAVPFAARKDACWSDVQRYTTRCDRP